MTTVQLDRPAPGVTQITLNRPERLNAMNADLIGELYEALDGVAADRSCRAVVLTGAGRGFCAGLDLAGYGSAPGAEGLEQPESTFAIQTHIASLVPRLRALRQPVIAAAMGRPRAVALRSPWRATSASRRPRRASTSPSSASASPAATSGSVGCYRGWSAPPGRGSSC
jgi:enoyl-CoA hydratase